MMNSTLTHLQDMMNEQIEHMENCERLKERKFFLNLYNELKEEYEKELKVYTDWLLKEGR